MKQAVNLTLWSIVVVICTAWLTSSNCILPTIFMLGWFPKSKLLFCGSDTALTISSTPTLETTYVSKLYSSPSCQDSSKCSNGVDFIQRFTKPCDPAQMNRSFPWKFTLMSEFPSCNIVPSSVLGVSLWSFFLGLNLTANIYSSLKYTYTHFQQVFLPLRILQ
jgi:hypothetical protein